MNKMEVGEYVRTRTGKITRLIKIDKRYVVIGHGMQEFQVYSKFENLHYIYANNYKELYEKINKYIVKHSFNIIDLIEVGDFVNENEVIDKYLFDGEIPVLETTGDETNAKCMCEGDIKTILTHEQYERNCYKIN